MPWTWRATRHARHSIPWKGDMRKYRSGIQELLKVNSYQMVVDGRWSGQRIRTGFPALALLKCSRCCADCGIPHHPVGQMDMSTPSTNGVAYANPWLGVFICHEYLPFSMRSLQSAVQNVTKNSFLHLSIKVSSLKTPL